MPWPKVEPVELRKQFIEKWLSGRFSVVELAQAYQVSRKTAHKWIRRFEEGGREALADRSHARLMQEHRVGAEVASTLLEFKRAHPCWGPKKIRARLDELRPKQRWPAPSTIGELYRREGLVRRRRGSAIKATIKPWREALAANDVWAIDFKGQWRLGDGRECYPLTLSDSFSRYLLLCRALPSTAATGVRPALERTFREFGLPTAIRSDWGVPFAAGGNSIGLSKLSVWWLRLGIDLQRIRPGRPQQNGRHERMHRTLKEHTVQPISSSLRAQQVRFDHFVREYNDERPHEALAQRRPTNLYSSSARPYPTKLPDVEYPGHFERRRVRQHGEIKLRGKRLFLSEALAHQDIGLEEDEHGWKVYFGPVAIAHVDLRKLEVVRLR